MKILSILLAVLLLTGCGVTTQSNSSKEDSMVHMMLAPSVNVIVGGDGFGSGTVFKVTRAGAYILTNLHVVDHAKDDIVVRFYTRREDEYIAHLHSFNKDKDIAVLFAPHLCGTSAVLGKPGDARVFRESICVGTSSKYPLAPSRGMVTQVDFMKGDTVLYRSDCNITFGNSGGGMYVEVDGVWKLVGIPTAVHAHTIFGNRAPVSFLGFMVRIEDILEHLEEHNLLP